MGEGRWVVWGLLYILAKGICIRQQILWGDQERRCIAGEAFCFLHKRQGRIHLDYVNSIEVRPGRACTGSITVLAAVLCCLGGLPGGQHFHIHVYGLHHNTSLNSGEPLKITASEQRRRAGQQERPRRKTEQKRGRRETSRKTVNTMDEVT